MKFLSYNQIGDEKAAKFGESISKLQNLIALDLTF